MARPLLKPTMAQTTRAAKARAMGCSWEKVAWAIGISLTTMDKWKAKGALGEEPYAGFLLASQKATADMVESRLEIIQKAAKTQWQAGAWLLERIDPQQYGRQIREHVGPGGGPQEYVVKWQKPIGADEEKGE